MSNNYRQIVILGTSAFFVSNLGGGGIQWVTFQTLACFFKLKIFISGNIFVQINSIFVKNIFKKHDRLYVCTLPEPD